MVQLYHVPRIRGASSIEEAKSRTGAELEEGRALSAARAGDAGTRATDHFMSASALAAFLLTSLESAQVRATAQAMSARSARQERT
jgi:hypothetical protein